jgi:transposase
MLFIGIDLSDKFFDSCICDSSGNILSNKRFDFDDDGFCSLVTCIGEHEQDNKSCIIGIENPRSRLVDFLLQREITVIPINPESLARYRESRFPSRAKSDPVDAKLISDYIREHHKNLRPINIPEDIIRELSILLEDREKLVEQKVRFSNQLTSTLKDYFPQALEAFGSVTNKSALEFLARFDTHKDVKSLSTQELEKVLTDCGFFRKDSKERFHNAINKKPSLISNAVIKAKTRLKNALESQDQTQECS